MRVLLGYRVRYVYNGVDNLVRYNADQYEEASRCAFVNVGKMWAVYRKKHARRARKVAT